MANSILIMGIVIAIGGKLVGVVYIALSENKSTIPWVALSVAGYLMAIGAQLGWMG